MLRTKKTLSNMQLSVLVVLRIAIGWHFLYEGLTKVLNPNWSAFGYLMDSKGFMSGFFHSMAQNAALLSTVDFLNEWGLMFIGLGLTLGCFTRIAAYSGMILLGMYYLSHPPLTGLKYALPTEGNYLVIDKVFIEFLTMWILALIPTGSIIGLDRLIYKKNH